MMAFRAMALLAEDAVENGGSVQSAGFAPSPAPARPAFTPSEAFQIEIPSIIDLRQAVETSSPVGAALTRQLDGQAGAPMPPVDPDTLRNEAFAAGRKSAEDELASERAALTRLLATLNEAVAAQLDLDAERLGPALGRLALAIAREVVGEASAIAPESITARVDDALDMFEESRKKPVLTVNDADAEFFEPSSLRMTVKTDPEIQRGDFRLTSGDAEVIDRIAQRLAVAERAFSE